MQAQRDNRSQNRSNVFLSATLTGGDGSLTVRVRNLSARGALVDGSSMPTAGTTIRLARGALSAEAVVAWQAAGQAGIRFTREINVAAWVTRPGHPGQQRVDDAFAAMRQSKPIPFTGGRQDLPSLGRIGTELDAICARLAATPGMTVELGEELVRLDALARAVDQLATGS